MELDPVIAEFEAALTTQVSLADLDPSIESAASQILAALRPAARAAFTSIVEQAAQEVSAQLQDQTVDVVLVEGNPSLKVSAPSEAPGVPDEELDARITLRLPPTLKGMIEQAAGEAGNSVNGWVVDALSSRARRRSRQGNRFVGSVDL